MAAGRSHQGGSSAPGRLEMSITIDLASGPGLTPESSGTVEPSTEAFTVNIPDSNGGYAPVVIKKAAGGGFTGPQGEGYAEFPSVEQLKALYGSKKDQ